MGWEEEEESGKERWCVCLWWGSQPRWHNKVRSTTLLLDPQISPFLWPSLFPSLSSLLLVFSPSWTLNPAGGRVFSRISSRILHCCSNYLSTPNPNCISFFYIHIPLQLLTLSLYFFLSVSLWWITSRSFSRSLEIFGKCVTLRLAFVDAEFLPIGVLRVLVQNKKYVDYRCSHWLNLLQLL